MSASPTQRTLAALRDRGYIAQVVERFNPHAKIRQDLFGFIDIVAMGRGHILGVQATSTPNIGSRIDKIVNEPKAKTWLESEGRIEVWGWKRYKNRVPGDRRWWRPTIRTVDLFHGEVIVV